jgi:aclacinomycin oxidase
VPYEKVSWRQCVAIFGGANSELRSKQKSGFVRRALSDAHIRVLYKYLKEDAGVRGNASFDLASFGGAINTPSVASSAFPERSAAMRILTQVYWSGTTSDALNLSWTRRFHQELFADQGGEPMPSFYWGGSYVNYPDRDLANFRTLYYGGNLSRLVQLKGALDPLRIFKHPQGVV